MMLLRISYDELILRQLKMIECSFIYTYIYVEAYAWKCILAMVSTSPQPNRGEERINDCIYVPSLEVSAYTTTNTHTNYIYIYIYVYPEGQHSVIFNCLMIVSWLESLSVNFSSLYSYIYIYIYIYIERERER